jgi:hypothetical protein
MWLCALGGSRLLCVCTECNDISDSAVQSVALSFEFMLRQVHTGCKVINCSSVEHSL